MGCGAVRSPGPGIRGVIPSLERARAPVVVDMIGPAGYTPTEGADDRLEALGNLARRGMAVPQPLGGGFRPRLERAPVDREDLAPVHHERTADHHLVDGRAILRVD